MSPYGTKPWPILFAELLYGSKLAGAEMVPIVFYHGMSRRDGIAMQLLLMTDAVEKVSKLKLWN
jgi:hypothetical protein